MAQLKNLGFKRFPRGLNLLFSAIMSLCYTAPTLGANLVKFEPGVVEIQCEQRRPEKKPTTKLGVMLDQLLVDFESEEARMANPHSFVKAMDLVIENSAFAPLLQCRETVRGLAPLFTYDIQFQDKPNSELDRLIRRSKTGLLTTKLILNLKLKKSVQDILVTYLHELTHVCQSLKSAELASRLMLAKMSPDRTKELDKASAAYYRDLFLGEIEATYNMHLAYQAFVKQTPNLCDEPEVKDAYKGNVLVENIISDGMFAQGVISTYMNYYKPKEYYLLDPNSQPKEYIMPVLSANFTLKKLNEEMLNGIRKLGIPVQE